jgi:alkylhydroperoxidase family enzyme
MDDRFERYRSATAAALLDGTGATSCELRRAVAKGTPPRELTTLVQKIRSRAYAVSDADVNALRGRYSEDQLFEIVVAAAFGAALDRLAAARRAVEES